MSRRRVAKSASCWPADGLNSDIIMIPYDLTVLHVGFMCEGIKMLFLRIRFFAMPVSTPRTTEEVALRLKENQYRTLLL